MPRPRRTQSSVSIEDYSTAGTSIETGVLDFLVNMSASADVLAQAKVELDLAAIPEGKNVSRLQTSPSRL